MKRSTTPKRRSPKKDERCKMVTYGGFFIMAGPAPKGIKPDRCTLPALPDGFCAKHDPKDW